MRLIFLLFDSLSIPAAAAGGRDHRARGGALRHLRRRHQRHRRALHLFPLSQGPVRQERFEYTLFPVHMHGFFQPAEFEGAALVDPFDFSKGRPMLRLPARRDAKRPPMQGGGFEDAATVLYDTATDPGQMSPTAAPEVEARLTRAMVALMQAHAPPEAYRLLDPTAPA